MLICLLQNGALHLIIWQWEMPKAQWMWRFHIIITFFLKVYDSWEDQKICMIYLSVKTTSHVVTCTKGGIPHDQCLLYLCRLCYCTVICFIFCKHEVRSKKIQYFLTVYSRPHVYKTCSKSPMQQAWVVGYPTLCADLHFAVSKSTWFSMDIIDYLPLHLLPLNFLLFFYCSYKFQSLEYAPLLRLRGGVFSIFQTIWKIYVIHLRWGVDLPRCQ